MKNIAVLAFSLFFVVSGCGTDPAEEGKKGKEAGAGEAAKAGAEAEKAGAEAEKKVLSAEGTEPKAAAGTEPKGSADVAAGAEAEKSGQAGGRGHVSSEERERLAKLPKGGLPAPDEDVVAWTENKKVSSEELRRYLERLPAHLRSEYGTVEKKLDMLRNLIRLEALVEMATKEGLDKDPDVVLAMKMEMAKRYLMMRYGDADKMEVSDEEIAARYERDTLTYNKPERVRASQVVLATRAEAEQVLGEMREEMLKPGAEVRRVFREYVRRYSVDMKTRRRGGDLLYFQRDGKTDGDTPIDRVVVDAAFATRVMDQISSVIDGSDGRYYIITVTSRREGVSKPLSQVSDQIRREIALEKLEAERKLFAETVVDFDAWNFDSSRVAAVAVEGASSAGDMEARVKATERAGAGLEQKKEEVGSKVPEEAKPDSPPADKAGDDTKVEGAQ